MSAAANTDKQQPKASSERTSTAPTKRLATPSPWLKLPTPLRKLFDTFPLTVYEANQLPQRIPASIRNDHSLHIFTTSNVSDATNLSQNPACLKWQAYLLIKSIPFKVVSANNHASPNGALPFVLPARRSKKEPQPQAISSSKISRWAETEGAAAEQVDISLDAYMALIDQNIRNAWLYALYLQPQNFEHVARKLYIATASSNSLVQVSLAHQLRAAATEQLLRSRSYIDESELYEAADAAFVSLSTRLGTRQYFSSTDTPGLFDVSLFAYTLLLRDLSNGNQQKLAWKDDTLSRLLFKYGNLIRHSQDVLSCCYGK